MLELWGMGSISLSSSIHSPIWPGVVAPDRVLSMGQIKCVLMLKWIVWNSSVYMNKNGFEI